MSITEIVGIASAFFAIGGAGIGSYITMRITIAKMQVKIEGLEKDHEHIDVLLTKIFDELKEIRDIVVQKADRK